jgi:hypothetical protein
VTPTPPVTEAELAEIAALHAPCDDCDLDGPHCSACEHDYPCPTTRLIAAYREQQAVVEGLERLLCDLTVAVDRFVDCDERPRSIELWRDMTGAASGAGEYVYPLGSPDRRLPPSPMCGYEVMTDMDDGVSIQCCDLPDGHDGDHHYAALAALNPVTNATE